MVLSDTARDSVQFSQVRIPPPEFNDLVPSAPDAIAGLPKREIVRFDGDPMKYWLFIRSFQANVMSITSNPCVRLSYLINYCEGQAREAIESCVILDPEEGFLDAMETLKSRFGRPHLIARAYIESLVKGPSIKANDSEALHRLAGQMKTCLNTLQQLNYEADLNATVTVSAVIRRLPYSFQLDWSKKATSILRTCREPAFKDLYQFVCDVAETVTTQAMYSNEIMRRTEGPYTADRPQSRGNRITTLATGGTVPQTQRRAPSCVACTAHHYLDQCPRFQAFDHSERLLLVSGKSLCELCLKANHTSELCRSRVTCGFNGCQLKHHPLLHEAKTNQLTSPRAVVNETNVSWGRIALGIIPILLRGKTKSLVTNALLDPGSDSSLVDEQLLQRLDLPARPSVVQIATVNGDSTMCSQVVRLELQPLEGGKSLHVDHAWAVKRMPKVQRIIPEPERLRSWEHLKDLPFIDGCDEGVGVLIGMNVPEAHWVLEHRYGKPSDPFAIRTPLGWILLGPVGGKGVTNIYTNSIS
ncbi:unnamed protein product, partial [Dicrocoelium dendriticum]